MSRSFISRHVDPARMSSRVQRVLRTVALSAVIVHAGARATAQTGPPALAAELAE